MTKKDKYYLKKYGITELEVQKMEDEQRGVCKICGRPPKKIRLNVDHDHGINKIKSTVGPYGTGRFIAQAEYNNTKYYMLGKTKTEAKTKLSLSLKAASVRGLLCTQCNRALGKVENPRWQWGPKELRAAAEYLERFNGKGN